MRSTEDYFPLASTADEPAQLQIRDGPYHFLSRQPAQKNSYDPAAYRDVMETIIGAVIAATAAVGVVRLTRRGERAAWLRQERLAAYSDLLSHFLRSDPARVIASAANAEDNEEDAAATMLTAEHELRHAEDELQPPEHKLQQVKHRLQLAEDRYQTVTSELELQAHTLELFARIQILGPPDMVHAAVCLIAAHRDQGIPSKKTRSSLNDAEQQFILTANYVIGEARWWKRLRQKM